MTGIYVLAAFYAADFNSNVLVVRLHVGGGSGKEPEGPGAAARSRSRRNSRGWSWRNRHRKSSRSRRMIRCYKYCEIITTPIINFKF